MTAARNLLFVVPCLNEEAHLASLLTRLRDDPGARTARIVVVDGGSSERSVEIVRTHAPGTRCGGEAVGGAMNELMDNVRVVHLEYRA